MKKPFSYKISLAIADAARAHDKQTRKGNKDIPYISHPVHVAMILSQRVDDEDAIIAALLHDTLEDTSFPPQDIENKYGSRVLQLVQMVSEEKSPSQPKEKTWRTRKYMMLDKILKADPMAQMIAMADDISNLQSSVEEFRTSSYAQLCSSFNAAPEIRLGLYHYRLNHLWKKLGIAEQCKDWLDEYQILFDKLTALLEGMGLKMIPFNPCVSPPNP